jgi:hypothetical protein
MPQAPPARPYLRRETEGETFWFLGNLVTFKATGSDTRGRLTVAEFVHPAGFAPPLHAPVAAPGPHAGRSRRSRPRRRAARPRAARPAPQH